MNSLADIRHLMNTNLFGPKTINLQKLKDASFQVPNFVAFSAKDLETITAQEIASQAIGKLPATRYAVRSSALSEDTAQESMAGQFKTVLDCSPEKLEQSIIIVLQDALEKLSSLSEFSIIIQEYIEPTVSGVVFTRNPNGNREMIVEWVEGVGEDLVSGKKTPHHTSFYRNQKNVVSNLKQLSVLKEKSIAIEELFNFPQDIEWAIKDNQIFFLQSRPITTINSDNEKMNVFLDKNLPQENFYYEKTEVSEVAPTPSTETLELLKRLYKKEGPVATAYKKIGVSFSDTDFLKIIGGQLYVDREAELKTILPSFSYLLGDDYAAKPAHIKRLLTSLKNQYYLSRASFSVQNLHSQITERLEKPGKDLFADYELIFTINLATELALQKLKTKLPQGLNIAAALNLQTGSSMLPPPIPPQNVVGNSLDLHDTFPFVPIIPKEPSGTSKQETPNKEIFEAQEYFRLREYGRWLAVLHLTPQRINEKSTTPVFPTPLPKTLTYKPKTQRTGPLGVSSGTATGVLVNETNVTQTSGKVILITSDLSPNLTKYLGKINGVISQNGGLLSHFAIIARENSLPVIVNVEKNTLVIGKETTVNGETGEITQK